MLVAGSEVRPTTACQSAALPFSPPLVRADCYFYFRDDATGLITSVQPVHFNTDGTVTIDDRIETGRISDLPDQTRERLGGSSPTPASESSN